MSLHLFPNKELHYHGPFTQPVKRTLVITNDNTLPVAFKIKTTSAKLFGTQPNQGIIAPGDSSVVIITFYVANAMKEETPLYERRSDKFLILSTLILSKNPEDLQSIWDVFRRVPNDVEIHSQKLRARYFPQFEEDFEKSISLDEIDQQTLGSADPRRPPSTSFLVPPPLPSSRPDGVDRDESKGEFRLPTLNIVDADSDPEQPVTPTPVFQPWGKQDIEQQLSDAQEEIRTLHALLGRSGNGTDTTNADARFRATTSKGLASGVEEMVAALRNFVHPLASPGFLDDTHSGLLSSGS